MTDKKYSEKMAILILSCDKYADIWDDFFNLKERFWADCPYKFYIVTESTDYERQDVEVIKCGKEFNWAGRYRYAVQKVDCPYIGVFLEDYLIIKTIDSSIIADNLQLMEEDGVDYINLDNGPRHILDSPDATYYKEHLVRIPKHLRYGLDTAAAIWKKEFLLQVLGEDDYSAWKFESDRCLEAQSEAGLPGFILCDDRQPFHVTRLPYVIQGVIYPPCVKQLEKLGYQITSNRKRMSKIDIFKYRLKTKASNATHCRKFLKWFGTKFLGYKFFTED